MRVFGASQLYGSAAWEQRLRWLQGCVSFYFITPPSHACTHARTHTHTQCLSLLRFRFIMATNQTRRPTPEGGRTRVGGGGSGDDDEENAFLLSFFAFKRAQSHWAEVLGGNVYVCTRLGARVLVKAWPCQPIACRIMARIGAQFVGQKLRVVRCDRRHVRRLPI